MERKSLHEKASCSRKLIKTCDQSSHIQCASTIQDSAICNMACLLAGRKAGEASSWRPTNLDAGLRSPATSLGGLPIICIYAHDLVIVAGARFAISHDNAIIDMNIYGNLIMFEDQTSAINDHFIDEFDGNTFRTN
jgi:hypothetical protein